ncbi:hypothetical protein [Flavobacterium sp.]|uniref:hypothetical protein n=1 Tax=Flavobacterium sp. TaxID=239 RepID=UPI00262B079F|nr:hypothetical protein [Flavobacterium sp.]
MKKMIAMAILMTGMVSFAQQKPATQRNERPPVEKLTPEQRKELRLKQLTLKLDLNASQQKEMATVIAEMDAKRDAARENFKKQKDSGKKLTADERYALKNKMLDEQIALKARLKKFLNEEQMKKWEKIKDDRKQNFKKRAHNRPEKKEPRN